MHITFDTLQMVQRLETKGFTRSQAEEVVNVVRDVQAELMTTQDGEILKKDILIGVGIMIASAVGILATLMKMWL